MITRRTAGSYRCPGPVTPLGDLAAFVDVRLRATGNPAASCAGIWFRFGHKGDVNHVAIAPDGTWLASAGNDRTARVWDVATGEQRRALVHGRARAKDDPGPVVRVAISADGRHLTAATFNGTVRTWNPTDGIATYWMDIESEPQGLVWLPDAASLFVARTSGTHLLELRGADGSAADAE